MEKRRNPRQRTLLGAELEFNKNHVYSCVVTNLSLDGAKVRCDGAMLMPSQMVLSMQGKGERQQVETIWRSAEGFGVSFTQAQASAAPEPSALEKLLLSRSS